MLAVKFKVCLFLIGISIATAISFGIFQGGKWDRYYKNKIYQPPREVVVKALNFFPTHGNALDLGCGVGNETG